MGTNLKGSMLMAVPLILSLPLIMVLFHSLFLLPNPTFDASQLNVSNFTTTILTTTILNTTTIPNTTINATTIATTTIAAAVPLAIMDPYAVIGRSTVTNATVRKGQITTITIQDKGASGGVQPYTYQWLESYDGGTLATATDCGAGNNPSIDSVTSCIVSVTPSMHLGKYLFKLEVTDATGTTVVDDGFTLDILSGLTVNLNPPIITNTTGSAIFNGTATGSPSGTYELTWSVNGTFANGTATSCTWSSQSASSTGISNLTLTREATLGPDSNGCSFMLNDGTYNVTFTAADAANPADNSSSTSTLIVDWPSGIFSGTPPVITGTTINSGSSTILTVAWADTATSYSVILFKSSSSSSCSKTGSSSGTNAVVTSSSLKDGSQNYAHQTTFTVSPTSTTTYCAYVRYYDSSTQTSSHLEANESTSLPITATVTVISKASPTIITTLANSGTITVGGSETDTATLSGASSGCGGSITFYTSTSPTCSSGTQVGTSISVTGNKNYGSSSVGPYSPVGSYYWYAVYSGDSNNNAATSPCETLTVNPAQSTTVVSCPAFTVGQSTTCTATVTTGYGTPTGSVSFGTSDGTGSFTVSSCTLSAGTCGVTYTDTSAGTPTVTATYGGNTNNQGSHGTTPVTVNPVTPTLTTTLAHSGTITAGRSETDSASLLGGYNPTGSITFYTSSSSTCASGTMVGSPITVFWQWAIRSIKFG